MTAARRLWLTVGTGALLLAPVDVFANATSKSQSLIWAIVTPLVGWAFILAGLIGWTRRPENGTGRLLVVTGGLFLVLSSLWAANNSLLYTIGQAFGAVYLAVFLQLLISYPAGRLQTRLERMAEGLSNNAIAERLVVTERAVEKHVTSIFGKLRLPQNSDAHRRVLAVLAFLHS